MVDVAIVGAGLAGLVCARHLQQAGAEVVVVEKSRGLGGRLATRRLAETWADHGVRYVEPQGPLTRQLVDYMESQAILHLWTAPLQVVPPHASPSSLDTPRYVSPVGLTAVAKALADGLFIHRGQRVVAIAPSPQGWTLTCEGIANDSPAPITHLHANVLALMIPAPQALALLEPLADRPSLVPSIQALRTVEFDPCITAIAAYPASTFKTAPVQALHLPDHPALSWIGVEASKQQTWPAEGAIAAVVQSSAAFAWSYLDAPELSSVGRALLEEARQFLGDDLLHPDLVQVHRWRYAFCRTPYPHPYLDNLAAGQLICGGDWCGDRQVEQALESGLQAAAAVGQLLDLPHPEKLDLPLRP